MTQEPATKSLRIRPDLWNAVLDYSSGRVYVWDGVEARPAKADEDVSGMLKIPTVTEAQYIAWKNEFVSGLPTGPHSSRFQAWATENLPTLALPQNARGAWNAELKKRVLGVLQNWFESTKQPVPHDFTHYASMGEPPSAAEGEDRLGRLRRLVVACVLRMSWQELSELKLPATALAHLEEPLREATRVGSVPPQGQRAFRSSKAHSPIDQLRKKY